MERAGCSIAPATDERCCTTAAPRETPLPLGVRILGAGTAARAAAPPASSGTREGTAVRPGRYRGRAATTPAGCRCVRACRRTLPGITDGFQSLGDRAHGERERVEVVELVPGHRGRHRRGRQGPRRVRPAMVRSRFAWLKSTKIRSPRSSFHQLVVTASGIRRSSSRAAAMTACRTSRNSCVGSIGQNTCRPRLPMVLIQGSSPASRSTARSSWAAVTASAMPFPAAGRGRCAARSVVGIGSRARPTGGTRWCSSAPPTPPTRSHRGGRAADAAARCCYVTVTASTKRAHPSGVLREESPHRRRPRGKRSSETGRFPFAAMKGSATAIRYLRARAW